MMAGGSHVAFSPDGQTIVTAGNDGTVRLWNTSDNKLLYTLIGHTEYINHTIFSSDGHLLATASFDNTARLWQGSTGKLLHTFEGHTDWLYTQPSTPMVIC